jgi:predicted unusual protein kinase regulating ubiquinone biosynthesis (AarF/ABC1/UbiB family)
VALQAVSSRPDFVPPTYARELEKLQDKIPPFPDAEAMQILRKELGVPASQVFSDFSATSIAAASLGQVGTFSSASPFFLEGYDDFEGCDS